ncbi:oxidoreductase alpha (molybdopterin) subunit [Acidothermus cellulolyticus 11B]|uniref:Oxidoreductase alpha (Molybdopterin) subunit n=1 Tax=Acidothermus cellulolyticus (strain ATCC 43068 / DSM 8971 / 11B) TaxID=351607 RepID=A0LSH3_ACIC1|nr:FdhF/YdeP family oxidoreductase [Acidothermus cellulolyticus]ABK52383.1 oxidoreductase alpha (molybdopterin) subunit [Acidothermus cellulolyticus 11B]
MSRRARQGGEPAQHAAGLPAVARTVEITLREAGVGRGLRALAAVNQRGGFECPSCAWPDAEPRHRIEFCENGAKAVAWEATRRTIGAAFFAEHSITDLLSRDDHWLESRGRLAEPLVAEPGDDYYRPVSWDAALDRIAAALRGLDTPDQAVFYTSGRTSNEAAFLYQLLARRLGTNNLPDCSNMCHESSGVALSQTIGVGKGSVTLDDIAHYADLIVLVGQNPGTNHPRMLSSLEEAKRRGARIVAVNPLPEPGLRSFRNPQRVSGLLGRGTPIADLYLPVRVGGDLALFQWVNRRLVERDARFGGGENILDHGFIRRYCAGFEDAAQFWAGLDPRRLAAESGLDDEAVNRFVDEVIAARSVVLCWAMGITQHRNAVPTIREFVNFLLLRGNFGRPGAGACPVRGHSNVQGDRTMGITDKPSPAFLERLQAEFGFAPPTQPGLDVVEAIRAMYDGRIRFFMGLGGNFAVAAPDTMRTAEAMRTCALTVHVATKLNRTHLLRGTTSFLLPALARSDRDESAGRRQMVTIEDSMGIVRASIGHLTPVSPHLRSEVSIVAELGARIFGDADVVPWRELGRDNRRIRERIARVVDGFADVEDRLNAGGSFVLPHPVRDERRFPTADGRAHFTVNRAQPLEIPPGCLLLQTIRSHDQFNTTIYSYHDQYRGVVGDRRVVFVNPDDLSRLGIAPRSRVTLVSIWSDGERRLRDFTAIPYPTPQGCAAAYFPEANPLVPLDSTALESNTPTSKAIVIRLEPQSVTPDAEVAAPRR